MQLIGMAEQPDRIEKAPPPQPRVAAIVLNWHDRPHTEICLDALLAVDYPSLDILLLDNGCADFDAAPLEERGIRYLRSDENLGYAGGNNLALAAALESGVDFVWFVNNDAAPEPGSLARLIAAATAPPHPAILGPKIVQASEPEIIDSIAVGIDTRSGRFQLLGHGERDRGQFDDWRQVEAITGCAMLVSAAAARSLAGFDERYFLYLEDLDLCLRNLEQGGVVGVVPEARVRHDRAPAGGGRQSTGSIYYTSRNHFLLMASHGHGGVLRQLGRNTVILAANLAFACRAEPARIPARLSAVLAGARDYFTRRFGAR